MNGKWMILIFIVIITIFLALFTPYTAETEIFTPEHIPGTEQNLNPDALKQVSKVNSGAALSIMQEFIDLSGTIVVNIRSENLDNAEEDIDEYKRLLGQYESIIVNLDMTKSEIEEYRQNSKEEIETLEALKNDLKELDDLKKLQIQYQNSDDPDRYYSVTYDLEQLKDQIDVKKEELSGITNKQIEYGERYELKTEKLRESVDEIIYIGDNSASSINASVNETLIPAEYSAGGEEIATANEDMEYLSSYNNLIISVIVLTAAFGTGVAGYIFYSKKRRKTPEEEKKAAGKSEPGSYKDHVGPKPSGYENETCILPKQLFRIIAERENVRYSPSMTNREFLSQIKAEEELIRFADLYETVVYSGKAGTGEEEKLLEIFNHIMNRFEKENV